ncbi:thioesterase domain-containing protein [Solwaraspora sp. WMMD1047]|uniref:thioesterase II family protein n=1 Tax=Solwaraspora sp. WMMD1047 TaxID=3016102 RepID=UPI002417DA73|nr:thioesterase domain-containing protein [Solwaraspora sp. WMMD1047]MDG4834246.1 thioesterase domain-containing protein [Solwaraspora sp. WMMD1047]
MTRWLQVQPVDDPAVRVCCAPRAGGSARDFDHWAAVLGPRVELCAVQLPGRLSRFREPPVTSLTTVAAEVATALIDRAELPTVLFGDCMGSLVVFEVARELRRRGAAQPLALMVASYPPPDRVRTTEAYHDRDATALRGRLAEVGGVAPEMLQDDELFELMLPTLRADFSLFETYEFRAEGPLPSDIVALAGAADPYVDEASLQGWRRHTTGAFEVRTFEGGHFFLRDSIEAVPMVRERSLRLAGN